MSKRNGNLQRRDVIGVAVGAAEEQGTDVAAGDDTARGGQQRLVVHATRVAGHAQVAGQEVDGEPGTFLVARDALRKLVSGAGSGKHLHQSQHQDRADQQRDHQLDRASRRACPWPCHSLHFLVHSRLLTLTLLLTLLASACQLASPQRTTTDTRPSASSLTSASPPGNALRTCAFPAGDIRGRGRGRSPGATAGGRGDAGEASIGDAVVERSLGTLGAHHIHQFIGQVGGDGALLRALGETHVHGLQQCKTQQPECQHQYRDHHFDQGEAGLAARESEICLLLPACSSSGMPPVSHGSVR